MRIQPLTGMIGAEITDVDLTDNQQFDAIYKAFIKYSVITLKDQNLSCDDHISFAKRFGNININRFFKAHPSHQEIALVLKEPEQKSAIGEMWHTDHSYDQEPALGSILHAIELPPYGGDTAFASMGAAYDDLSETMKNLLSGLKAWNSSRHVFGYSSKDSESQQTGRVQNSAAATQDNLHPVVIEHPLSHRKCLYVNPQFTTQIEGMSKAESAAILNFLYHHCEKPEFQCRVRWQQGDVTIWDNRATWHKAINDYQGHRRLMHRVTIDGCSLKCAG